MAARHQVMMQLVVFRRLTGLQFMIDDILLSLPVDEDDGTQFPS